MLRAKRSQQPSQFCRDKIKNCRVIVFERYKKIATIAERNRSYCTPFVTDDEEEDVPCAILFVRIRVSGTGAIYLGWSKKNSLLVPFTNQRIRDIPRSWAINVGNYKAISRDLNQSVEWKIADPVTVLLSTD